MYWSLTDNWEWTWGLEPRFGLIHADYATQGRMVKEVLFRHLNKKERTVVHYYYYEGLSMREIAGMLRLTESRVCQIHSKVIRRLREMLESRKQELFA